MNNTTSEEWRKKAHVSIPHGCYRDRNTLYYAGIAHPILEAREIISGEREHWYNRVIEADYLVIDNEREVWIHFRTDENMAKKWILSL